MFKKINVSLEHSEMRVFVGGNPIGAFVWTADLATALDMQTPSIRSQISKHGLDKLMDIPELREHLIREDIVSGGKVRFASEKTWKKLVKPRVSPETWANVSSSITSALEAVAQNGVGGCKKPDSGNDSGNDSISNVASTSSERALVPGSPGSPGSPESPQILIEPNEVELNKGTAVALEDDPDAMEFSEGIEGGDADIGIDADIGSDIEDNRDEVKDDDNDNHADYLEEEYSEVKGGSSEGGSSSGDSEGSDSDVDSDSNSSSSSDSEKADSATNVLPVGVPAWVLTEVEIPSQFSAKDYSKAYALKSYDTTRALKKEFKKLGKWWMKTQNSERAGKMVQQATAEKRKERVLCYLGFILLYKCLAEERDLCLGLCLNHKLFESYLDYLQKVRQNAPGTIGEALTAIIYVCKWLYRKNPSGGAQIIRRYKDWRNHHQNQAIRMRKQEDKEDLVDKNKWIDWSEFTGVVSKLRGEWNQLSAAYPLGTSPLGAPGIKAARALHDLLLLGLYSCVPARGAEVRLLEYVPEEELQKELRGKVSLKKFVETQQINLITRIDGTWKMILSQYKNVRTHGIDCTDLSHFEWWTKLFEKYIQDYRPKIVSGGGSRFVFVTRHGESFTHSYFSDFISSLLFRLSGKKVATNMLRSSFVTHFYNTPESSDPVMRESIASIMRHSVSEAQKTYDRRTSSQKKRKGLDLLAEIANNGTGGNDRNDDGEVDLNPRSEKRQISAKETGMIKLDKEKPQSPEFNTVPDFDSPKVVLFKRAPYKIIRDDGAAGYVLAKMQRSLTTNAPTYFVPPETVFELKPSRECTVIDGTWEEDEFTIGVQK